MSLDLDSLLPPGPVGPPDGLLVWMYTPIASTDPEVAVYYKAGDELRWYGVMRKAQPPGQYHRYRAVPAHQDHAPVGTETAAGAIRALRQLPNYVVVHPTSVWEGWKHLAPLPWRFDTFEDLP